MIYGQPVIQVVESIDMFFELLLPRTFPRLADIDWRAKKLKEFIDSRAAQVGPSLDDVCQQLGLPMSARQARRLFKVSIGMSIREYAKNRRLAVAANQLQATDVPVKVIAADAGYRSTRNFARRFKELFRLRPVEFRRVWRRRNFAA